MSEHEFRLRVSRAAERMSKARTRRGKFFMGLGMVGALGWMIVLPTIGGAAAGRYLDERFGTQTTFSILLLLLGLAVGAYSVWRFMLRDLT